MRTPRSHLKHLENLLREAGGYRGCPALVAQRDRAEMLATVPAPDPEDRAAQLAAVEQAERAVREAGLE